RHSHRQMLDDGADRHSRLGNDDVQSARGSTFLSPDCAPAPTPGSPPAGSVGPTPRQASLSGRPHLVVVLGGLSRAGATTRSTAGVARSPLASAVQMWAGCS